jgi:uroporphyrin-III C-methyltransferase
MHNKIISLISQPLDKDTVYIVGAGVGAVSLLTLRAINCLMQADIVLHDNLVSSEILDLIPPQADLITVGKTCGKQGITQEQINQLLVEYATQGKLIVRLKGGDPCIFARSGEEIAVLAAHNIKFEIVSGVTAASACAAFAGISLTHRDYASQVLFLSGHSKNGKLEVNWQSVQPSGQTLVFYMGLNVLAEISASLIKIGVDQDTPAMLVEKVSSKEERAIVAPIAKLAVAVQQQSVPFISPCLLIVGEVLKLADSRKSYS